jgi:intein/homing endonuclease
LTDNGYKTIKEIEDGDKVAYYSHTGEICYNDRYEIYFQGTKEVFEIELEDGSLLELTADHEVLTQDGYKKVSKLTETDFLVEVA